METCVPGATICGEDSEDNAKIAVCVAKASKLGDYDTKCASLSKGLSKNDELVACGCCGSFYVDPEDNPDYC